MKTLLTCLTPGLMALLAILFAQIHNAHSPDAAAVSVRPTDVDQKGHVNNARYLEYLQVGRWHWLESHGLSNDDLERTESTTLVVVNVNINYRRPIRYGDAIEVVTESDKKSEKVVVFQQTIRGADETVCADAVVTTVAVDTKTKKSRPLPARLDAIFAKQ